MKTLLVILGYQVVPLLLIGAWIMPVFFDLFGVDWNDTTWRMYAATAGGWAILEIPLIVYLLVGWRKRLGRAAAR